MTLPPPLPDQSTSKASNAGQISAAEQGSNIPTSYVPSIAEPVPVVRCTANRRDGQQCNKWSIRGATVCFKHGGNLPNVQKKAQGVVQAAKLRMMGMSEDALDVLEELIQPGTSEGIRLKAATELLDRAGLKAGMELSVTVENVNSPYDDIAKSIAALSSHFEDEGEILDEEDIVDAEVEVQDSTVSPESTRE